VIKKLRAVWQSLWVDVDRRVRLGRVLGLLFITAGFVLIGLAWNGAAGKNFIQGQFPYLISGGIMGLGLIVTGALLILLSTVRAERQALTDQYQQLTRLLGRNLARLQTGSDGAGGFPGAGEQVVATDSAYHRQGCRVLEGKEGLMTISVGQAVAEGLGACRVCGPPAPPESTPPTSETPAVESESPSAEPKDADNAAAATQPPRDEEGEARPAAPSEASETRGP
jgi:hypothetical protein